MTVQQQQAEQMKVFWRVRPHSLLPPPYPLCTDPTAVHRGDAHEPRIAASRPDPDDAAHRAGVRSDDRSAGDVYGGCEEGGAG